MRGLFEDILAVTSTWDRIQDIKESKRMTWGQVAIALCQILEDSDARETGKPFCEKVAKIQIQRSRAVQESQEEGRWANWAKEELDRAGLFDKGSDYEGKLGDAIMELVGVFSRQDHSGMSAAVASDIFKKLTSWKPLTPLTDDPDEWMELDEDMIAYPDLMTMIVSKKSMKMEKFG